AVAGAAAAATAPPGGSAADAGSGGSHGSSGEGQTASAQPFVGLVGTSGGPSTTAGGTLGTALTPAVRDVAAEALRRPDTVTRMTVRLSLPDLGEVSVRFTTSHGIVDVALAAATPAATAALQAQTGLVRAALADHGLALGSFDVDAGSGAGTTGAGSGGEGRDRTPDQPRAAEPATPTRGTAAARSTGTPRSPRTTDTAAEGNTWL
ncbi:MAG: Flagellar hook-length control protein FliK, partial [Mycobacterium sp.]|nr:Flagellar hook-length control protein FliK [Mycobacterium sp.]